MKSAKLIVCLAILPVWTTVAVAATIQVGPTRTYTTVGAGYNAASAGDTIEIDSGTYYQSACWINGINKANLTFRGVGPTRPVLDAGNSAIGSKGIFVVSGGGYGMTVDNLEFANAWIPDGVGANAAGIREGNNMTIRNCRFYNCQDGILGGSGVVLIEYSEFDRCGEDDPSLPSGYGYTHNMYMSQGITQFTLQHCWSHDSNAGHVVKTRAQVNRILYNLLSTETGTGSRELQICNAGPAYVIGNVILQGPNSDNSQIVVYGDETNIGGPNPNSNFYLVNNTIINQRSSASFVSLSYPMTDCILQNNIFQGNGNETLINGSYAGQAVQVSNWRTTNAHLMNPANHDYHLTSASTGALNAGTAPGTGFGGVSLTPVYQYIHLASRENRPVQGAIDIGAYEFLSSTNTPPVVDAGTDQTVQFPAAATLAGSAVDDGLPTPPGMMTYTWTKASGPGSVNFANANALSTTATFSVGGTYVLQLAAYDGALTGTDTVTITVNTAPTVHINAGPNWAYEDWPITLSCSASDADGDTLNYAWSQTSGVAMALAGAATSSVSFTTPHMLGTIHDASMSLRVTVSDGKGGTASDTISLFVYMTGDIDHDYNVNLADLKLLVAAWNSWPGRTNWNPAADLDNDGSVTLSDLKLQLLNWNRAMLP